MDHDIDAIAENVQLRVGDQRGDLDQRIRLEIKPGHFTVDPH